MASKPEFVQYIADQLSDAGNIAYRKIFIEYLPNSANASLTIGILIMYLLQKQIEITNRIKSLNILFLYCQAS